MKHRSLMTLVGIQAALATTGAIAQQAEDQSSSFSAKETVSIRSDRGSNHAEIVQSGDPSSDSAVEVEKGPGYVYIRQHSKNNRAIIIQQTRPQD